MYKHLSELSALFLGLYSDLQQCKQNLRPDRTGSWDRTYVRCFFSLVEGIMFRMRQILLSASYPGVLQLDEAALLAEKEYRLDSNGRIKGHDTFLRFLPGIQFTFRVL